MLALREALPISFVGLIAGLAAFLLLAEHGSIVDRFRDAFSSKRLVLTLDVGFTSMSVVLLFSLATVLARRLRHSVWLELPATLAVFALSMPHPRTAKISDYALALGASGLFLAIVVALLTAGALSLARRELGAGRTLGRRAGDSGDRLSGVRTAFVAGARAGIGDRAAGKLG